MNLWVCNFREFLFENNIFHKGESTLSELTMPPESLPESPLLRMLDSCKSVPVYYPWTEDELIPVVPGKVYLIGEHYWRYTESGWQMLDDVSLN